MYCVNKTKKSLNTGSWSQQ